MGLAAILALVLELLKVVIPIVTQQQVLTRHMDPALLAGDEELDPAMFPDALKARVCELASYLRH